MEELQTTTVRPSEGVLCHVCQVCFLFYFCLGEVVTGKYEILKQRGQMEESGQGNAQVTQVNQLIFLNKC